MDLDPNEWVTLERCGVDNCRSRRYFYDSGYYQCERGHRHHGAPVTGEDEDSYGTAGRTTKKKPEAKEIPNQHFSGREAFELYLQCYQLILRKQIRFLTQALQLPTEFEEVIKELWALRLLRLETRIPNATSSDGDTQYYSSQTEGHTTGAETDDDLTVRYGKSSSAAPNLKDALATCYLGLRCLRLPYTPGDILVWVDKQQLIYYEAKGSVSEAMLFRLPAVYQHLLEPDAVLQADDLVRAIIEISLMYQRDHQITFPALNAPLCTFRVIERLALPLEVYSLVDRLTAITQFKFDGPQRQRSRTFKIIDMPEARLASLLVVAIKLVHPFDDVRRHPFLDSDFASTQIDWEKWNSDAENNDHEADLLRTTEADAFDMDDEGMAKYLHWYQRMYINEKPRGRHHVLQEGLFRQFPLEPIDVSGEDDDAFTQQQKQREKALARLQRVHSEIVAVPAMTKDQALATLDVIHRPGTEYMHYRRISDVPERAKLFLKEIARISGVGLDTLLNAVFSTERKLETLLEDERLRERRASRSRQSSVASR